jgi:lysophospholipase L1-like esterase
VPPAAMIGAISQEPPPVPPRLSQGPISAVGATRFVAFGDSITYGVLSSFDGVFLFDTPHQSYPVRVQLGLNAHHAPQSFTVINRGVPGETAASGASRIGSVLASDRPQVLLLLEGINDLNGGASVGTTTSRLATILDTARLYNVTVIIGNMFQTYETVDPNDGHVRHNAASQIVPFNNGIAQITSGRSNVFVVDLYHAFATAPNPRSLVGGDGLHPTEAGYERMASWFEARIEQAFPVRGAVQ